MRPKHLFFRQLATEKFYRESSFFIKTMKDLVGLIHTVGLLILARCGHIRKILRLPYESQEGLRAFTKVPGGGGGVENPHYKPSQLPIQQ